MQPTNAPVTYDYNTGKALASGQAQSLYNTQTGQKIGAPVPTSAPTGQTSTNQPPASPIPVISSTSAGNSLAQTIIPAVNKAQNDVANQNATRATAFDYNTGKPLAPGQPQSEYNTQTGQKIGDTPPVSASDQAATAIANTPDAGYKFAYSTADGTRTQVPLDQTTPDGYMSVDPNSGSAVNTVSNGTGLTFKQLNDGSYGRYDSSGAYIGPSNQQEFQNAQSTQDILNKLNQATLGSYPLTASQQAQIDATKAQFSELMQEQAKANDNLTGGTTVAQNLYGLGNTVIGLGAIQDSVTQGISKIAGLQTQLATSVASMTEAFNKDNLSDLKDAYTAYSDTQKELQANITKTHDDMVAAAKDARDYNLNVQKLQEQSTMDQFNQNRDTQNDAYDQARNTQNDTFDQAYKTADLNEREKTDAFDQAYKMEDLAIKKAAAAGTNVLDSLPSVPLTQNGAPDPTQQAAFLAGLPPAMATAVKGLTDYSRLPSDFSTKNGQRAQVVSLAQQYDPTYNETNAVARQSYLRNLNSGELSKAVLSANKSINHLTTFASDVSSLGNMPGLSAINALGKTIESPFNPGLQQQTKQAQTEATGLKDELAKFFKGAGVTDTKSIDDWAKSLDVNATPAELKGTVQGAINLLAGQINSMNQQYVQNVGKPPEASILQPETLSKLSVLKNQGFKVDIPGVLYTDAKAYVKNDPNGAANLKQVISAYPNLSQDDTLQLAQSI